MAGVGLTVVAMLARPVGAAAGTVMAAGLVGRSSQVAGRPFPMRVQDFLANHTDHGHEVINRDRDFCGGLMVGLATAFRLATSIKRRCAPEQGRGRFARDSR